MTDAPSTQKPLRVVASLTTMPGRYDVLKETLLSLQAQTHKLDAIYLGIPKKASRINREYPPLPDDFKDLCTVVPMEIDYGPLSKIFGGLMMETDPDTVIITCDDDTYYEPTQVAIMLKHHRQHPNVAICGTGALIGRGLAMLSIVTTVHPFRSWGKICGFKVHPTEGRDVDLIFGVAGVLYRRGFFPDRENLHEELFKYALQDHSVFCNDDVLISAYLSREKIKRKVFTDIPTIRHVNGDHALSSNLAGMVTRLNRAIAKVKEYGMYTTMEPLPVSETAAFQIGLGVLVLIILILLCILIYQYYRNTGW